MSDTSTNTNAIPRTEKSNQMHQQAQLFYSGKTVLVTGAAGFVASHLVEALLTAGARVIGIDNFLTGREQNINQIQKHPQAEQFTFIEADAISRPESYLGDVSPISAVFHLASPASPPRYQAHPVETYQVNSFATHSLLAYLHQNHSKARFIFASTSEVYGDPEVHPQPESYWGYVNPNGIRSCYDEAKRLGESICGVFERDFDMDVRILRIFNTYGPRMDPDDGRVIPNFIKQAIQKDPITIYGNGGQTRSYCYVSDLVEGILRVGGLPDLKGITVNMGNPDEYTILETARVICELVNNQPLTEEMLTYEPLPGDDPVRRRPDISHAQELLGWNPTVSLVDGLSATVAYFGEIEGIV